jgi:hypothetical protein
MLDSRFQSNLSVGDPIQSVRFETSRKTSRLETLNEL